MKSKEPLNEDRDFQGTRGSSRARGRYAGTQRRLCFVSVLAFASTLTCALTVRAADDSPAKAVAAPQASSSPQSASTVSPPDPSTVAPSTVAIEPAAAPPTVTPAPYSLPWQLRPIIAPTVIRSDTSIAAYENAASAGGTTIVTSVAGAYKVPGTGGPSVGLSPVARVTFVNDSPPAGNGGIAIVNPLLGAGYAMKSSLPR